MPTVRDILAKGYLPRELPPCFSTVQFAAKVTDGAGAPNNSYFGKLSPGASAELCVHNLVRSGGLRRNLGIPNPARYALLAREVVNQWGNLRPLAHRSAFSLTKPVDTKPDRAISAEHNLDERVKRRVELRTKSRVILKTDINRFYPSLYTHAVPWALQGKVLVKAAKAAGTLAALWSDNIDKLLRNMNDQQTVGVPIGPDCSLLIAEAVLGAIDEALVAQVPGIRGLRYIDDYEFAFDHRSQAEDTINKLQAILSQYELALNPAKTRIIELPEPFEPLWTSRLRTFPFRSDIIGTQRNDLTAYFDTVFSMSKVEPDESIIKYAIPRLNTIDVEPSNWPLFEKILSQCALVEPASLPQVLEQLVHYGLVEGLPLDQPLWEVVLNRVISERLPLGQSSEAAWAMWAMKLLGLSLSVAAEVAVNQCEDSVAALMGLFLAQEGLANAANLTNLNTFAERTGATGRHWLLCYEGNRQGWIAPPSGAMNWPNSNVSWLANQGVSFMDLAAIPPSPRRITGASMVGGGGDDEYPT